VGSSSKNNDVFGSFWDNSDVKVRGAKTNPHRKILADFRNGPMTMPSLPIHEEAMAFIAGKSDRPLGACRQDQAFASHRPAFCSAAASLIVQ
jgi:hypothetical protein